MPRVSKLNFNDIHDEGELNLVRAIFFKENGN